MAQDKLVKIFLLVFLCFDLLALESLIKYFFINKVSKEGFYFFENFFQIIYTPNPNIAFSVPLPQNLIIVIVILILIVLSFIWWHSLARNNLWELIALSLIILGALSNLIDRLFFGYVIDYI